MKLLSCFLLTILLGSPLLAESKAMDTLKAVNEAHGYFELLKKRELRFTFNVEIPARDLKKSRSWVWDIQKDTFTPNDDEKDHGAFINDTYWLFFPLRAYFDADQTELVLNESVAAPLSGKMSRELVVRYTSGEGASPNDTYKIYLDEDDRIFEWSYHKKSAEEPRRVNTFEGYTTVNGVSFAMEHKSEDGFRLWFSDLELK